MLKPTPSSALRDSPPRHLPRYHPLLLPKLAFQESAPFPPYPPWCANQLSKSQQSAHIYKAHPRGGVECTSQVQYTRARTDASCVIITLGGRLLE